REPIPPRTDDQILKSGCHYCFADVVSMGYPHPLSEEIWEQMREILVAGNKKERIFPTQKDMNEHRLEIERAVYDLNELSPNFWRKYPKITSQEGRFLLGGLFVTLKERLVEDQWGIFGYEECAAIVNEYFVQKIQSEDVNLHNVAASYFMNEETWEQI